MELAPRTFLTKELVYQETFRSPFEKNSEQEALKVLQAIRDAHPASAGWIEIKGEIEELPNGRYRAVREHALYR